ncbi:acetamidase [Haloplanus rubicundus]|uniref:Acetamidase n=1 Tax=Haloplanus rubicundus TaxID=1547898 RepID=A0A345EDM3_9EURY|nr:acetamidase [Haloplanus rubicundus]AXG10295.1 acetamidase [Haloplanus rubicundus]
MRRSHTVTTHELTEGVQGEYHYTVGPYPDPVLEVAPGDTVEVETHDAFEGAIETEDDLPSEVLGDNLNPQNGPIYVEGATPGDALAITIDEIEPRGPQPRGTTCTVPHFGGLSTTDRTAMLHEPLPEIVKKLEVTTDGTVWNDDITIPYEPFVGTISTSPKIDSVNALTPFKHGGNMDLPDVRPGNTIYLPVEVDGGYVYLGDCHAAQGDGELCGVALEHPTNTTITVDLIEDWELEWPRLESDDFVMSIGSARPMEDAARAAYADLVTWMADDYGFDEMEAYMLLTQVGHVRLGNMVDPNYTIGAGIDKSYL